MAGKARRANAKEARGGGRMGPGGGKGAARAGGRRRPLALERFRHRAHDAVDISAHCVTRPKLSNPPPFSAADPFPGARRTAPAVARNRDPILDVLKTILPERGLVLEIASGTGEHVVHFAQGLPQLEFQPSDPAPGARESVEGWLAQAKLPNVRAPLDLDASAAEWPVGPVDAVICINMLHISPWTSTEGLMRGAAARLPAGGPLFIYGAFRRVGVQTAPSNEAFDADLRRNDARWGLRYVEEVAACAAASGLDLEKVVEMPSNNLSLILRRRA